MRIFPSTRAGNVDSAIKVLHRSVTATGASLQNPIAPTWQNGDGPIITGTIPCNTRIMPAKACATSIESELLTLPLRIHERRKLTALFDPRTVFGGCREIHIAGGGDAGILNHADDEANADHLHGHIIG